MSSIYDRFRMRLGGVGSALSMHSRPARDYLAGGAEFAMGRPFQSSKAGYPIRGRRLRRRPSGRDRSGEPATFWHLSR
jgi:hypothetical protein